MPRSTNMRARGRRAYSMSDHGHTELGVQHGKHILRQNGIADLWTPAYGDGGTVIRILPALNPESTDEVREWDPYRFSMDELHFGDWIRRYPAVRSMGNPGVTYISHDPADDTLGDAEMTPGWILFRAIDKAIAEGQDRPGWAAMLRGGRGRGAMLSKPSEVYLVQAAIVQHKARSYRPPKGFGDDDRPVIFELGPSAGLAMISEFNKVNQDYNGPQDDWEAMLEAGDPVSLDYGRFVHFYKLADGDPRAAAQGAQEASWTAGSGDNAQGGGREPIGYGCYTAPTWDGLPANLRGMETQVRAKLLDWDEVLHFPTVEEQAHLLADRFPADVITYAFRDHPTWIPEKVANEAVNRTVAGGADVPNTAGAGAPTGAPTSQPPAGGWGPGDAAPAPPAAQAPPAQQAAAPAPAADADTTGWSGPSEDVDPAPAATTPTDEALPPAVTTVSVTTATEPGVPPAVSNAPRPSRAQEALARAQAARDTE